MRTSNSCEQPTNAHQINLNEIWVDLQKPATPAHKRPLAPPLIRAKRGLRDNERMFD